MNPNPSPAIRTVHPNEEVLANKSLERLKRERQLVLAAIPAPATVALQKRPRAKAGAVFRLILRALRSVAALLRPLELYRGVGPGEARQPRYEWEKWEERRWG